MLGSLLFVVGLNRALAWEKRRAYNDLIGWQLSVLGTTYAVVVGFMLYIVWSIFGEADLNVELEANAVLNIYLRAEGMPEPQRTQLRTSGALLCQHGNRSGAAAVVSDIVPEQSSALNQEMWKTVIAVKAASPTEVNTQQSALAPLSQLAQYGLTRTQKSAARLPGVLWRGSRRCADKRFSMLTRQ